MRRLNYPLFFLIVCVSDVLASDSALDCHGQRLPNLEKANPSLECAVLIDDKLTFPRNIVVSDNGDIWLIDKGSHLFENSLRNGALYRYRKHLNGYTRQTVLTNLEDPNDIDIRQHQDGQHWLYFTTRYSVVRMALNTQTPKAQTIIDRLPTNGWHKLLAIHIHNDHLFLTVPSSTDHCEKQALAHLVAFPCFEENDNTAQIRRYDFDGDTVILEYAVVAQGLRDALAVQISNDGRTLIAADNGWDQVRLNPAKYKYANTPHDEINFIDLETSAKINAETKPGINETGENRAPHYGWPYCFDRTLITPPYEELITSCDAYAIPDILLDAHSAPLGMLIFQNELLINLHGNNDAGAKTIAFSLDEQGLPSDSPSVKINWRYDNGVPGRPLGLAALSENTLLVTDDWRHQLIKLVFKHN